MLVSALGDGMSMVAMAWLAVQIAPLDQAGVWTVLAVAGLLDPVVYVNLLAVSSLLHAWGSAGAYTLIAESLPEEGDRVNGYAILSTFTQAAVVVGPALAGGLAALVGPGWVIGADAMAHPVRNREAPVNEPQLA